MDKHSPLPKNTGEKEETPARHVGMRSPPSDPQGADITEPPAPLEKKGFLERLKKPREESRHPPEY